MFGRTSRMRAMAGNVADMERRMRMLERDTRRYAGDARRYAGRGYAGAVQASEQVGDVVDAAISTLSDAIQRFSAKPLSILGKEAAERVAQQHAWPRVFERLFCIYREVCANYNSHPAK